MRKATLIMITLSLAVSSGLAQSRRTTQELSPAGGPDAQPADSAIGAAPQKVIVGDFNRDGRPDLPVANPVANTLSILLGDGLGGFDTPTHFAAEMDPFTAAVDDFNRDGKPGLAVSNMGGSFFTGSPTRSILLGDGRGSFGPATSFDLAANPGQ